MTKTFSIPTTARFSCFFFFFNPATSSSTKTIRRSNKINFFRIVIGFFFSVLRYSHDTPAPRRTSGAIQRGSETFVRRKSRHNNNTSKTVGTAGKTKRNAKPEFLIASRPFAVCARVRVRARVCAGLLIAFRITSARADGFAKVPRPTIVDRWYVKAFRIVSLTRRVCAHFI